MACDDNAMLTNLSGLSNCTSELDIFLPALLLTFWISFTADCIIAWQLTNNKICYKNSVLRIILSHTSKLAATLSLCFHLIIMPL